MNDEFVFWYVHAQADGKPVNLGVAAQTKRSAKVQARKTLGKDATIGIVAKVQHAHAWVLNLGWLPRFPK